MKQLLGDSLTLRDYDGQVAEAMGKRRLSTVWQILIFLRG
jgi:hypothetical protein